MKNKLEISLLFVGLVITVLVLMNTVGAVVTCNNCIKVTVPTTLGSAISGASVKLNATNSTLGLAALVNCTLSVYSVSTANSSWTKIANETALWNSTVDAVLGGSVNGTFNTRLVEDANNYYFNVSCRNITNDLGSNLSSGWTIDNSIPTVSSVAPATNTLNTNGTVTFSATIVGANQTNCYIVFPTKIPGNTTFNNHTTTMTESGTTCSFTIANIPEDTYQWYIRTTDKTNTTDSTEYTLTVDITEGKRGGVSGVSADGRTLAIFTDEEGNISSLAIVIVAAVVVIVIFVWIKRR